ncbi:Endonuclease, Uma2 family (restriction endonuclease fold) [Dyadobacter soli]|uniref:Endonuclease, Uma2 family (Restriction endonuclease fold) n=1 Tax=Dyadobacter soli TaxID=659014 RepID=A0A1G7RL06_9BACT|nr:Uma2 family endonuclease [Dyadobacter soli]SDG11438.1 Endonuclease, Uma2 family (restriction endonuclease fold) [Dyadobacter soli]
MKSIDTLDLNGTYSYADYLKWQFEERLELIKGKIFKMSPAPAVRHQQISMRLSSEIWHLLKNRDCQVFAAPFDVRLPRFDIQSDKEIFTVVQPDVCVVCDPTKIDEKGCVGAPDWIIEILSPGNTRKEMDNKFDVYEESGVKEYWLVEPNDEVIFIYLLDEQGKFFGTKPATVGQTLTSVKLPDFTIDLNQLFDKK